jgi:hypothetical protein
MSSRSPRVLLGAAWLGAAAYAIVYAWLTAWPYARIAFQPDAQEKAVTLSNCRSTPECAPDAVAHLDAQQAALDNVVLVVRGTAALITVVDVALLIVATIAVLTARTRGAGRLLGAAWVVQAVVTVLLFVLYVFLLVRGQSIRDDIPRIGRTPTFDTTFEAPLIDAGTIYYVAWFVIMNVAVLLVIRSLGRVLRALTTPAPGSATPAR